MVKQVVARFQFNMSFGVIFYIVTAFRLMGVSYNKYQPWRWPQMCHIYFRCMSAWNMIYVVVSKSPDIQLEEKLKILVITSHIFWISVIYETYNITNKAIHCWKYSYGLVYTLNRFQETVVKTHELFSHTHKLPVSLMACRTHSSHRPWYSSWMIAKWHLHFASSIPRERESDADHWVEEALKILSISITMWRTNSIECFEPTLNCCTFWSSIQMVCWTLLKKDLLVRKMKINRLVTRQTLVYPKQSEFFSTPVRANRSKADSVENTFGHPSWSYQTVWGLNHSFTFNTRCEGNPPVTSHPRNVQ